MDAREPYWVVWYGTWTRHYFAVPVWETPSVLVLHARTPAGLVEEMRAAEIGRWAIAPLV